MAEKTTNESIENVNNKHVAEFVRGCLRCVFVTIDFIAVKWFARLNAFICISDRIAMYICVSANRMASKYYTQTCMRFLMYA